MPGIGSWHVRMNLQLCCISHCQDPPIQTCDNILPVSFAVFPQITNENTARFLQDVFQEPNGASLYISKRSSVYSRQKNSGTSTMIQISDLWIEQGYVLKRHPMNYQARVLWRLIKLTPIFWVELWDWSFTSPWMVICLNMPTVERKWKNYSCWKWPPEKKWQLQLESCNSVFQNTKLLFLK